MSVFLSLAAGLAGHSSSTSTGSSSIIMLIMDDREPSITLAWLFILLFLPFIGVFFYIFFGRDWKVVARRKGWVQTLRDVGGRGDGADLGAQRRRRRPLLTRSGATPSPSPSPGRSPTRTSPRCCRRRRSSSSTTARTSSAGSRRTSPAAQRFIHLQYFIWEQDRLTAELVPILLDRLEAGVEVRIMYDWMGCISFRKARAQAAHAGRRAGARPTSPTCCASTTATTARSSSSTARSATPAA